MFYEWLKWQAESYSAFPEFPEYKYKLCTCHLCIGHHDCVYDGDLYNTDYDCLASK